MPNKKKNAKEELAAQPMTELTDEELDRQLRAGAPVKFGDSGKFESAMQRDMEAAARHGSQVHRR